MKKYLLLFIFASFVFLAHFAFTKLAIYGDGIDYWAYLPSIYFDHDIDFENEYKHIYTPENNNSFTPKKAPEVQKTAITSVAKVDNLHLPGTAILWFPAFFLADLISAIFSLPRNGFADIYQILCGIWSVALVVVGLSLNEKILSKFAKDERIKHLSVNAIFLATPLLYYGSYDILNSHFASFFMASLFWYLLLTRYINSRNAIIIGIVGGLATLVRLQDVILIPLAALFIYWKKRNIFNREIFALIFSFLITILPIFYIWKYLYGKLYPETYVSSWITGLRSLGSLFHKTNGLFSRTPILFLSLLVINKFRQKNSKIFFLMFSFFVTQFVIISLHGGWLAAAYGGRMYISSLPFFAICLSYLLTEIKKRWTIKYSYFVVIFFSIINILSIMSFVLFEKEVNSGINRGLEPATQERVERIINKLRR